MASTYPNTLDNFATTRADATPNLTTQAADHNNFADAINKIEAELGITPRGVYANADARLDFLEYLVANVQAASYTLALADAGKVIEMNNAAGINLTVPLNSTVAFPIGAMIEIFQLGAGQVTIVPVGGVTIRSSGSKLRLTGQYSSASLRKRATDEWVLVGDITT